MDPLADSNDIQDRLGRDLTDTEIARVNSLLRDASSAVRNYMRQDITEATTTVRLAVRSCRVRLPQRPVSAVSAVEDVNGNSVIYTWEGFDSISPLPNVPDCFAWEPFRNGITAVDVTYTHGFNPIPDDIIGVVCNIVLRAFGRDPVDAGLTSESIQGYSYSLGAAGAAGGFGMLNDERAILDTYRREGGVIRT